MTSENNASRGITSRRTVTKGLGWSVPAVAAASAAPAFAYSPGQDTCYSLQWTTKGSTSTTPQNVTVNGADGSTGVAVVTPGVSGGCYNIPGDANYGPLNLSTTGSSAYMQTWVAPSCGVSSRNGNYSFTRIEFPKGASGQVSFTLSDLECRPNGYTDKYGANYYVDSVQVISCGKVVAPSAVTGAYTSNGWTTAKSSTPGSATFTVDQSCPVEIRLRNAYTGVIPKYCHPNQTIVISPLVCGPVAPGTPPEQPEEPKETGYCYRERASQYGETMCYPYSYKYYRITNQVKVGTSPLGFTVVNDPVSSGSGTSPATTITAHDIRYVLGLPKSSLDSSCLDNPFTFTQGGSYWKLDRSLTTEKYMQTPSGCKDTWIIYTFRFQGPKTHTSVSDGRQPTPWPCSAFTMEVAGQRGKECFRLGHFWGGYTGEFTASNGGTVKDNTLNPHWVPMD